jgi:hypothetical protein
MNNKANNEYTDIVSNGGMDPRHQYEQEEKAKLEKSLEDLSEKSLEDLSKIGQKI